MESGDRYIKASRYDLKAQSHNRRVFHRELVSRPWRALVLALGMSILGANAVFNLVDAPGWNRHPWLGWSLGVVALLFVCDILVCAVLGWQRSSRRSHETKL